MKLKIKKLKGKNHIQLIDENGVAHHIGPFNGYNMKRCVYTVITEEIKKTTEIVKDYLMHQGENERKAKEMALEYATNALHSKLDDIVSKIKFNVEVVNQVKSNIIEIDGLNTPTLDENTKNFLHKILTSTNKI